MKKILSAVLAAAMLCTSALMFSACGGSNSSAASDGSSQTEVKELHMATNAAFEPYEYKEGGEVVGIDADIANAICEKLVIRCLCHRGRDRTTHGGLRRS